MFRFLLFKNMLRRKLDYMINLVDKNAGCDEDLSTHLRREKLLRTNFDFIQPERQVIKTVENVTMKFSHSKRKCS